MNRTLLLDAHVHLDAYGEAIGAALHEIEQHGILTIAVASDLPSWERTREIAARSPLILPAFGIHPARAASFQADYATVLPHFDDCAMVGEIGLDYHWVDDASTYPAQRRVLDFFLEQAARRALAVNLHTKGAEADIVAALRASGVRRAIVHWYSGPADLVEPLLELGAYFTFGCELPYSAHIRELSKLVPGDRLLSETDNPVGYAWLAGETGMPRHVLDVLTELARLRGLSIDELSGQVWKNFLDLARGDDVLQSAVEQALAHRRFTPA